jgi:hypothetical protein
MKMLKKVLMGVAALAAFAAGGAAIANATAGSSSDPPDAAVTGADATRAGASATKALGGGDVVSVERSDEGGGAVFEVKVRQAGTITEVQVDDGFGVTAQKPED